MIESFLNYLAFERKYSSNTIAAYKHDLSQCHAYLLKDHPSFLLESACFGDLRTWVISLMQNGLTERSVNRKIASLKSFYHFLQKRHGMDINPAKKLSSLKTGKEAPDFINEQDAKKLIDLLRGGGDAIPYTERLVIELLYGAGIRQAELIDLKWSDVDLDRGLIKVTGKRNKQRIVPLPLILVQTMKAASRSGCGFVVATKENKKAYPMMIYRIANKWLSLLSSSQRKSPHVLRHSYATHMLNSGADLNTIKELLGHSSLASTQVYTHNSLERIKKVFEKSHPKS